MPKIEFTARFVSFYQALSPSIRKKVDKAIVLLAENPRHPSLQTRPIQGARGIYEARVDLSHRMTYERLAGDVLLLRVVGRHDETIEKP